MRRIEYFQTTKSGFLHASGGLVLLLTIGTLKSSPTVRYHTCVGWPTFCPRLAQLSSKMVHLTSKLAYLSCKLAHLSPDLLYMSPKLAHLSLCSFIHLEVMIINMSFWAAAPIGDEVL